MGWSHYGETSRPAHLHVPVACLVFCTCAASAGACVALRWPPASSGSNFAGGAQGVLAEGSPPIPASRSGACRQSGETRGSIGGEAVKRKKKILVVLGFL